MTADSAAASIILRTRQAFWPLLLEPKLGSDAGTYEWAESNFAEEEIIMHGSSEAPNSWLPSGYKDWDALLTEAVRRGLERGKASADLSRWKYGDWHVVDLEHPLFELTSAWSRAGRVPENYR